MTRKDAGLKLLQISDTHLHAAADSRMRGVTTYATFLAVLEQAKRDPRWPVDAILATGDIVQDESRAGYERFRAALEPLGVPVYCIPGQPRRPDADGRDPHERLVPARRRAAPGRVVGRAAQHVPRRRGRGRLGPRAPFGFAASAARARGAAHPRRDASSPAADGQRLARRRRAARRAGVLEGHRRAQRTSAPSSAATCIKLPTERAIACAS